mgnify:CR=1 FL=1
MSKNYKWVYSYENYSFNTIDGDLHVGEYALANDSLSDNTGPFGGKYLVYDPKDPKSFLRIKDLSASHIVEIQRGLNRAFDVFEDPDTKKQERFDCDLQCYRDLVLKGAGPRTKIKE